MPDLPTITVTQGQADKILEAFGGTLAVAVPAYKEWLADVVRKKVLQVAAEKQLVINNAATTVTLEATRLALPPELPPPV